MIKLITDRITMAGAYAAMQLRAEQAEAQLVMVREAADGLVEQLEAQLKRPVLMQIKRQGRSNIFTFARNGEVFTVTTYATMNDDVAAWTRDLLEEPQ